MSHTQQRWPLLTQLKCEKACGVFRWKGSVVD